MAVVIKGPPGTGKGLIINTLMGAVYGENYVQLNEIGKLLDRFNEGTANNMFINLDEATFGGRKVENQQLKNFITEPYIVTEQKYKERMKIKSYANLVITTNEDFPVAISEGDRRFFVLECAGEHANDHAYWAPMLPLFTTGLRRTADLFYRHLMHLDLAGFNVRDFPYTDARGDIMAETRDNVAAFVQDLVLCPNKAGLSEVEPTKVPRTRLYELYKLFERNKEWYGGLAGQKKFSSRVRKLLDITQADFMAMKSNGEGYVIIPALHVLKKKLQDKRQWMEEQFEAAANPAYPC